jgi:hypothetical protein
MEQQGSLSSSKYPAICPYPEIDEFSQHPHVLSLADSCNIGRLGYPRELFPSDIPSTFLFAHACYMPWPYHLPWVDYSNNPRLEVQIMKFPIK